MTQAPTPTADEQRERIWAEHPSDAVRIDPTARVARCRSDKCQMPVWFGYTLRSGSVAPFDIKPNGERTGTLHWRTCLDRERFKK